jgi:membrane-associated protein
MHLLPQAIALGSILDPTDILKAVGPYALIVIVVMVFVENGLLFPFLPGDSLVFAAAILVGSLGIPLWLLILIVAATATAGGHSGYAIGKRIGPRLFKDDARIFKTKYRVEATAFFSKYGAGAVVLARFVPVVRTFMPPVVGASSMRLRTFAIWNATGALAWSAILCIAGFYLGKIPFVANNIEIIAVLLVIVSVLPIVIGALVKRHRDRRAAPAERAAEPANEIG